MTKEDKQLEKAASKIKAAEAGLETLRGEQQETREDRETQKVIAERIKVAAKELRWAAANLEEIYNMVKPENMSPIEDPNQLKLFNDDEQG